MKHHLNVPLGKPPAVHANAGTTELEAARTAGKASLICREAIVAAMSEVGPLTPEEAIPHVEIRLGRPIKITGIRPRFTELKLLGLIESSGTFGRSDGGRCRALRWQLVQPRQSDMFSGARA